MSEELPKFEQNKYEVRNDGDIIVLSGEERKLAELGNRVVEILNKSKEGERIVSALLEGETIRPGGAYAVYIRMGKLYVDTRNARGDQSARDLIKRTVETVLSEDSE